MITTKSPFSPPPPDEKPRRRWAWPVIVLVLVLLPVLAGVLWYLSYHLSGSSAVQQLEAKIKARGEPVTLADLAATYPPIPDQSNGAVLLLQEWKKESPAFWQAFEDGAKSMEPRSIRHVDEAVPFLGSGLEDVSRSTVLQPTNIVAAEKYLWDNREHLEAVRIALQYSQFRFPVKITNGFGTFLPHLSEVKREARNFCIAGLMASERGDTDAAIEAMEDTVRAGDTLADEPYLISQLVRLSVYGMVVNDLERLLSRHSLTAAQLNRVANLLNRMKMTGAAHRVLVCQRAMDVEVFKMPPEALARLGSGTDMNSDDSVAGGLRAGMRMLGLSAFRESDEQFMLETFEQAIPLVDRDDSKAFEEYEALYRKVQIEAGRFPPKILSNELLPVLERIPHRFGIFEARRRSAATAIAVERFRLAHDRHLPATLDELKPQFLAEVAKDPFDDQPLRFQPRTNGYVIYSVGSNRRDDGGKERTKKYSPMDSDETFTVER